MLHYNFNENNKHNHLTDMFIFRLSNLKENYQENIIIFKFDFQFYQFILL